MITMSLQRKGDENDFGKLTSFTRRATQFIINKTEVDRRRLMPYLDLQKLGSRLFAAPESFEFPTPNQHEGALAH